MGWRGALVSSFKRPPTISPTIIEGENEEPRGGCDEDVDAVDGDGLASAGMRIFIVACLVAYFR